MKKNYLAGLFLAVSTLFLTSCDKDDDKSAVVETKNYLIGKWDLKLVDIKVLFDGEVYQEMEDYDTTNELTMQFNFKDEKTVELYQFSPATEDSESETFQATGTYVKNGNDLTITIEDEATPFKIVINDNEKLHLFQSYEETYQGIVITQETTFKFTKM